MERVWECDDMTQTETFAMIRIWHVVSFIDKRNCRKSITNALTSLRFFDPPLRRARKSKHPKWFTLKSKHFSSTSVSFSIFSTLRRKKGRDSQTVEECHLRILSIWNLKFVFNSIRNLHPQLKKKLNHATNIFMSNSLSKALWCI